MMLKPNSARTQARAFFWLVLILLSGLFVDARTIPTHPPVSSIDSRNAAWLPPTSENFEYDVRGNLTSDSRWDYTWDGANRLRFIETSATAVAAGVAREKFGYRYDYQGRRVAKDVYVWTGSAYESDPSETTLYYYDGWTERGSAEMVRTLFVPEGLRKRVPFGRFRNNLVYEATYTGVTFNSGVPTAATFESEIAYHWGLDWSTSLDGAGGVGGLTAITFREAGGSPETRYPRFDGNGNLVLLADEAGTITAAYEYGPYGELWRASGPDASRNPFRFSTKYHDAETKLYYYGHRYYSPDYGRFISQDPIREDGGLNLYAFVNNNPTNYYDYLGMFFDFGGAFDSASNFVGGVSNNFFQFDTEPNFESGLGGGWELQVPTYDFGMAYYDYGGLSDFTARTTSSSGSNWSYALRTLDGGSFKYRFDYAYDPGVFSYSFSEYGDYARDSYRFTFQGTHLRDFDIPEYNLWTAAAEGLGQGAYETAMSFRRNAESAGELGWYLWNEPVDTVMGMHDQVTTNLADGYFLLKDTSWSDVGRDVVSFGDLYANDSEFRGGITDQFTGAATGFATGGVFSAFKTTRTNFNQYETIFEAPITGTTRSAHRTSANRFFTEQLENSSDLQRAVNSEFGTDVLQRMNSGAGRSLINPPGAVWHHPVDNPGVMRLLRTSEHTNPMLQPVLHPNNIGGYGTFYGQ